MHSQARGVGTLIASNKHGRYRHCWLLWATLKFYLWVRPWNTRCVLLWSSLGTETRRLAQKMTDVSKRSWLPVNLDLQTSRFENPETSWSIQVVWKWCCHPWWFWIRCEGLSRLINTWWGGDENGLARSTAEAGVSLRRLLTRWWFKQFNKLRAISTWSCLPTLIFSVSCKEFCSLSAHSFGFYRSQLLF